MHFDGVRSPEASLDRIAETRRLADALGRDLQVWTPVGVICRPTRRQADDYLGYLVEHADWGALGHLAELHASDARTRTDTEGVLRHTGAISQHASVEGPLERQVLARGSYCAVGDADHVTQELLRLHAVGFDGLVLNFVNYLDELPYFAHEVLPRLERQGVRTHAQ